MPATVKFVGGPLDGWQHNFEGMLPGPGSLFFHDLKRRPGPGREPRPTSRYVVYRLTTLPTLHLSYLETCKGTYRLDPRWLALEEGRPLSPG